MNMKKFKKVHTLGAIILAVGATSVTAFASSGYTRPAEAVAALTGQTVESVVAEKQASDKTYGTLAAEAGKLDEFKKENLEMKKRNLKAQVESGRITQAEADEIIKAIEENQKNCDGTGTGRIGHTKGGRFGSHGRGRGEGPRNSDDRGQGGCRGRMRLQD